MKRARLRTWIVACVLALHGVIILALNLGAPTGPEAADPVAAQVDLTRPTPQAVPKPRGRSRTGGAPLIVVGRAPARSPPAAVTTAPTHVATTAPVDVRPAATPHLVAPAGPTLAAPVAGPGDSIATGGSGRGSGDGPGGSGGDAEPRWIAFADAATVERHYPAHALDHHVEGVARLRCRLGVDGRPRACEVVTQTPPDEGFGHAALALAKFCRFEALRVAGRPTEAPITFPIEFSLRDEEPR